MTKRARTGDSRIAVGILRVSTEDQHLGPRAQAAALDAWASREGVELVAVYLDRGVSGAAPLHERPGLLAALAALRVRGAGVLVAAKRDRLARDVVVAGLLEREVTKVGAVVRTADGTSSTTGPEGVMLRGIADVFAAYEREMICARTRAALAVKRARGEKLGGKAPYGFTKGKDGRLVTVEAEQSVLVAMRELRAEGLSQRRIADALAARGMVNRAGRRFGQTEVARMLARAA